MTACARTAPFHGHNLSDAWAKAFLKCFDSSGNDITLGIVSFDVNTSQEWRLENNDIREALDNQLGVCPDSTNPSNVETVAGTIFPESIWRRCDGDRQKLFAEYDKIWPSIKKCTVNRYGNYFRRLTAFGRPDDKSKVRQLEKIISYWNGGGRRHSALQAALFDPHQDHRPGPYLGFPCLQQLVFHPKGNNGSEGLEVVAFYANQILLQKAYGNYLGLYRLGEFMAGEMGLELSGVTCVASHLTLAKSGTTKGQLMPLVKILRRELSDEQ